MLAETEEYGSCSVFGPYRVNVPIPFPMGDFKVKFDTTKPIRVAMFSQPLVLYSGAWGANDTITVTVPLSGHHKFVVFGTGPDGSPTYAGCIADSTDGSGTPVSVQNATLINNNATGSNSSPDAKTGSNSSQWVGAGGVLVLAGALLWVVAARRRRDQGASA